MHRRIPELLCVHVLVHMIQQYTGETLPPASGLSNTLCHTPLCISTAASATLPAKPQPQAPHITALPCSRRLCFRLRRQPQPQQVLRQHRHQPADAVRRVTGHGLCAVPSARRGAHLPQPPGAARPAARGPQPRLQPHCIIWPLHCPRRPAAGAHLSWHWCWCRRYLCRPQVAAQQQPGRRCSRSCSWLCQQSAAGGG